MAEEADLFLNIAVPGEGPVAHLTRTQQRKAKWQQQRAAKVRMRPCLQAKGFL